MAPTNTARAALDELLGSAVHGIRIFTLDELRTSDDERDIDADLAIELWLDEHDDSVALFAWGVNFGIGQLCIWRRPLQAVWPRHTRSSSYALPRSWAGWPSGRLRSVEAFKLGPSELGIKCAELRFEHGGVRIGTGGLSGDEADSLLLSPLD